jgi:hypothetical protein
MSKLIALYVDLSPESPLKRHVLHRRHIKDGLSETFEVYVATKKINLIENILNQLSKETENFYEKLCTIDLKWKSKNKRRIHRYFAKSKSELSVDDKFARKISDYWINGNAGTTGNKDLIREACEAADIKFAPLGSIKIGRKP